MTDITIPLKALEAAKTAWYANHHRGTDDRMTITCLAMLEAWPGAHEGQERVSNSDFGVRYHEVIILPLPQENTNAEG